MNTQTYINFGHSLEQIDSYPNPRGRGRELRVYSFNGYILKEIRTSPNPVFQLINPEGTILDEGHWFPLVHKLYDLTH